MMEVKYSFLCGLRGYHEYRLVWTPSLNEVLPARHEPSNLYDPYAIACMKRLPGQLVQSVVGHLPKEIARLTWYIIFHGAVVSAKVVDVHHRRSPLVQGGLEVPVEVTVEMELSEQNKLALQKFEALVQKKYKEPVDGNFEDVTTAILREISQDSDSPDSDSGSEIELESQHEPEGDF